jgi:hypothetical protein
VRAKSVVICAASLCLFAASRSTLSTDSESPLSSWITPTIARLRFRGLWRLPRKDGAQPIGQPQVDKLWKQPAAAPKMPNQIEALDYVRASVRLPVRSLVIRRGRETATAMIAIARIMLRGKATHECRTPARAARCRVATSTHLAQ